MAENEELLEIVDDDNRVVGTALRGEVHGNPALKHRAVHIFVRNRQGQLFLQRRSRTKVIQPGRWDTSVGGHVDPGESYRTAAVRELEEELGVRADEAQLTHLYDYRWETDVETELIATFLLAHEGPFTLHPEEIEEGRFFDPEALDESVQVELTPNLEEELRRLKSVL